MHLTEVRWEHMGWIYLAVDVGKWWAFLNTLLNFLVLKMLNCQFPKKGCCVKLVGGSKSDIN